MSNKYETIDEVCQACNAWAGPKRTWNTSGHWAQNVPLTHWNPCSRKQRRPAWSAPDGPDLHESGVMHMLFRGILPNENGIQPFTAEDFALLLD